tara:strand:+ start:862 stop:1188 length:327 start_codon:yes stop_codon:yes gene_type:complete
MATINGRYSKATIDGAGETTVLSVDKWKAETARRGTTFFCRASLAGTLRIKFIDRDGVSDSGNELRSETLTADTLTAVDFDLPVPRYLVTFQRSGSDTGTCAVEVFDY